MGFVPLRGPGWVRGAEALPPRENETQKSIGSPTPKYYVIVDQKGKIVFEGLGRGYGPSSFMFGELNPNNLGKALKEAHNNLMSQPLESL